MWSLWELAIPRSDFPKVIVIQQILFQTLLERVIFIKTLQIYIVECMKRLNEKKTLFLKEGLTFRHFFWQSWNLMSKYLSKFLDLNGMSIREIEINLEAQLRKISSCSKKICFFLEEYMFIRKENVFFLEGNVFFLRKYVYYWTNWYLRKLNFLLRKLKMFFPPQIQME